MRKLNLLIGIITLCLSVFLLGCSDNSTENNLTEGDYQDPNYQSARSITEGIVDSVFLMAEATSNYIDFNGSAPMQATDSLLITFDEETCWWHLYLGADTTGASLLFIDSLKFEDVEGCQQFPDSMTTTSIEYRAFIDIDMTADSATIAATAHENLLLEGIQEDTCVFDATASSFLELVSGLYDITYDYSAYLDNVKFLTEELMNDQEPRPVSGSMALSLTLFGTYQQNSGSWNWNITITFNEGGYHARAESGENYWEWDVTYVA